MDQDINIRFNISKKMAFVFAIFFVLLDRLFKVAAISDQFYPAWQILPFFRLRFMANYHIAFSIPLGGVLLLGLIVVILFFLGLNLWNALRKDERALSSIILLIMGGAASNLYDRIKFGYVIDYFDLDYFTVFNIADCMIVVGVTMWLWLTYKRDK